MLKNTLIGGVLFANVVEKQSEKLQEAVYP